MKIIWILILIHGNVSFILYWLFLYLFLQEGIIWINERFKRGKLSGFKTLFLYFHYTQYAQLWIFFFFSSISAEDVFIIYWASFKILNRKYLFMHVVKSLYINFFLFTCLLVALDTCHDNAMKFLWLYIFCHPFSWKIQWWSVFDIVSVTLYCLLNVHFTLLK